MSSLRYWMSLLLLCAPLGCIPAGGGGGGGSGGGSGGDADTPRPMCVEGDLRECVCPDGSDSLRVCDAAGMFGDCQCEAPECEAGSVADCFCQTGDGQRTCDADGTYGECVCPEPPPEYRYVTVVDNTFDSGGQGVDGADLCGMVADCDGVELTGVDAILVLGGGHVCDGTTTESPCDSGVNRADPRTILDTGALCDPANSALPPSHYVSLGLSGQIAVEFERDLQGCDVTVVEHAGRDTEPYDVYVCQSDVLDADTCIRGEPLAYADQGGEISFEVPSAE